MSKKHKKVMAKSSRVNGWNLFHIMTDNDLIESVMPIGWKPEKEVKAATEKPETNKKEKELVSEKEKVDSVKPQTPETSSKKEKEKTATVPPMGAPTSKKEKKKKVGKEEVAVELQAPAEKIAEAVQEGVNNGTMTATVSTTAQLYYAVDEDGHIVYDQYGQPIMFTEPLVWSWVTKTWRKAA